MEKSLVVPVVLGGTKVVTTENIRASRRAPDRSNGDPYDSVAALTREHGGRRVGRMEFVSYAKNLSLVAHPIYYRHRDAVRVPQLRAQGDFDVFGTQGTRYPLIKEYTLNDFGKPPII